MKKIIIVSDGIIHPPFRARRAVSQLFNELPDIEVSQTDSLNRIIQFELNRYSALVFYFHHKHLTPEARDCLDTFVKNGGGILAIHSASASFKDEAEYFEILGGRFTGHDPMQTFLIEPADNDESIFDGIDSFSVLDELYLHEITGEITIHFTADHEGKPQPVVWTQYYGNGRVCYISPGHRTETMKQQPVQEILKRGLTWILS